jgi:hypothetical protein|nr:hypothetical protein Q903MT_gene2072 [Picea sitchensis]
MLRDPRTVSISSSHPGSYNNWVYPRLHLLTLVVGASILYLVEVVLPWAGSQSVAAILGKCVSD